MTDRELALRKALKEAIKGVKEAIKGVKEALKELDEHDMKLRNYLAEKSK